MQGIIDRFEGDKAVIIFKDSQQLVLSRDELPQESKEGDEIDFGVLSTDSSDSEEQAKAVLNEILNSKS